MELKILTLSVLAGHLLLPGASYGQIGRRDSGVYIRGHVRLEPNFAAEGVKVELKRQTGQVLDSYYTRMNGEFEFHGLSLERYVLEAQVDGFQPMRQVVEIIGPPGLAGVVLVLRRSAASTETVAGPVSARELAIPAEARAEYGKAEEQLREKKDAGRAVSHLKNAVKAYPEYYEAHQLLGVAYMEQKKPKEAEEAFRASIAASKENYGPAYVGLASLLSDTQKFAEAEALARRAVELDEKQWQGHYEVARASLGLGRAEQAEASTQRAVALNVEFARGYLLLAKIHQALKNYPAMLADVDEFLRREPRGATSDAIRKTRAQLAKGLSEAGMQVPAEPPR